MKGSILNNKIVVYQKRKQPSSNQMNGKREHNVTQISNATKDL